MSKPKRRKWNIAVEADEDMTSEEIASFLDGAHGVNVVNVEEVETSFTEEPDVDDLVPR